MRATTAPRILLSCCFILSLLVMWPGIVSPDAMNQYVAAIQGIYNDHHPPLMGFVWQLLDRIYAGSGLLLLMHLAMLYGAATIFIHIFRNSNFKWWYAIFPLVPSILAYTPLIAKDLGFAFSYLLAGALLAYLNDERIQKHKWLWLTVVLILLFYGTCVKYQARFILPFFSLGFSYCALNYNFNLKSIIVGLITYLMLLQAMFSFNNLLVPTTRQSHSWQLVKLYDLAAMSIAQDKPLFPDFVSQHKDFSFPKLKQLFSTSEVDPLVFGQKTVLRGGSNEQQRAELLDYWRQTVKNNPWLYLKVRSKLWICNLTSTPASRNNPADFIKDTKLLGSIVTMPEIRDAIGKIFLSSKFLLKFLWISPLPFLYSYIGWRKRNQSRAAVTLLIFNLSAATLMGILLFLSMAATARYLFICTCLVHASHGFAYRCLSKDQS